MIFQRDQLWTHVVSAGQNKIYFKKCGAIALTIDQIVVLRTVAPTYLRSSCKVTNSIERPKFYFQNIPSPKPSMQANLICNYLWHGPIFSASTLTCLDDRCMCCSLQVREKASVLGCWWLQMHRRPLHYLKNTNELITWQLYFIVFM